MTDFFIPLEYWGPLNIIIGSFSVIACLILFFSICKIKSPNISLKCIGWIAFISTIESLLIILSQFFELYSPPRQTLSIASQGCIASSLLWSSMLAYYSCKMITLQKRWNYNRFYNICCLTIVPSIALITVLYCLVVIYYPDPMYRDMIRSFLVLPALMLGIIVSLVSYCRQVEFIKANYSREFLDMLDIRLGKLTLYPLILVLAYLPVIILQNFVIRELDWVGQVTLLLSNCVGLINAGVYSYARNVSVYTLQQADNGKTLQCQDFGDRTTSSSFSEESIEKSNDKMLKSALLN